MLASFPPRTTRPSMRWPSRAPFSSAPYRRTCRVARGLLPRNGLPVAFRDSCQSWTITTGRLGFGTQSPKIVVPHPRPDTARPSCAPALVDRFATDTTARRRPTVAVVVDTPRHPYELRHWTNAGLLGSKTHPSRGYGETATRRDMPVVCPQQPVHD